MGYAGKKELIFVFCGVVILITYPCPYYIADEFDSYIVVSFINATLVLSIGETVEEVTDSGFLGTTPTLSCSQLGEDALLQVCKLISVFFNCFVL